MGDGKIASVDVKGPQTTGVVSRDFPEREWGHTYEGWSRYYGVEFAVGDEEEDMPLTDEEIEKIARAVWQHKLENTSGDQPQAKDQPAKWFLNRILDKVKPEPPGPHHN
jgi:hypothetical protein